MLFAVMDSVDFLNVVRASASQIGSVCGVISLPQCLHKIAAGLIASLQNGHTAPVDFEDTEMMIPAKKKRPPNIK